MNLIVWLLTWLKGIESESGSTNIDDLAYNLKGQQLTFGGHFENIINVMWIRQASGHSEIYLFQYDVTSPGKTFLFTSLTNQMAAERAGNWHFSDWRGNIMLKLIVQFHCVHKPG